VGQKVIITGGYRGGTEEAVVTKVARKYAERERRFEIATRLRSDHGLSFGYPGERRVSTDTLDAILDLLDKDAEGEQ
jgi:uncharacterized membrane protein (UPF0127 family)